MIDFKKHCCICGKLRCTHEIDDLFLCDKHFIMVIGTMTFEGPDDYWHFENIEDLKLF